MNPLNVRSALDEYRFNEAASEMYTFVWDEFCSWYIEFCKGTLYNDNDQNSSRVLDTRF